MISAILFTCLFFTVYSAFLRRWWKKQVPTLPFTWILAAYGFRILLGMLYGYIYLRYYNGDDTWYFNDGATEEYLKLLRDPLQFFKDPDPFTAFRKYNSFAENWYYYLSDLEFWIITKPLALVHWMTGGNYYLNIVCFNAVTLWGSLWLYTDLVREYPRLKRAACFWLFFFPPLVFWWSGIRADGLLFFFTALLWTGFRAVLRQHGSTIAWLRVFLAVAGIMILRSVMLGLWIPALLCWYIHDRYAVKAWKVLLLVYGAGTLLFFGSAWLSPAKNLPGVVVHRQQQFFELQGNTRFALDSLSATPQSFLRVAPQALENTLLRPYLWEAKGALQWLTAGDVALFLLALALMAWYRNKFTPAGQPAPAGLLYPAIFGITLYLFIGYTIPFPGAIVRYKVQGEIFLWLFLSYRLSKD